MIGIPRILSVGRGSATPGSFDCVCVKGITDYRYTLIMRSRRDRRLTLDELVRYRPLGRCTMHLGGGGGTASILRTFLYLKEKYQKKETVGWVYSAPGRCVPLYFSLSQRKVPKEGDHGQSKPFDAYSHAYPLVLDLGTARGRTTRAVGVPVSSMGTMEVRRMRLKWVLVEV